MDEIDKITQNLKIIDEIIYNVKELIFYLPYNKNILSKLELADITYSNFIAKLSNPIKDQYMLYLCSKQIYLMTSDLLNDCKKQIKFIA